MIALAIIIAGVALYGYIQHLETLETSSHVCRHRRSVPFDTAYMPPKDGVSEKPRLHLLLTCPDGRRVGQDIINDKIVSTVKGAVFGSDGVKHEWILVPDGNESCKFSVSSQDDTRFLAENPGLKSRIGDWADSYTLYAKRFDPKAGIFSSEKLTKQSIKPGERHVIRMTGTKADLKVERAKVEKEPLVPRQDKGTKAK